MSLGNYLWVLPILLVSHYAEGTLMPLAVNKLVFSIVPGRSPFLIRPIVRTVFDQLTNRLVNPQLKRNLDLANDIVF